MSKPTSGGSRTLKPISDSELKKMNKDSIETRILKSPKEGSRTPKALNNSELE